MKKNEETNAPAAEPVADLTPEQLEELKTQAAAAKENWERLLRTTADFENFKKRAARERTEASQNASLNLIQKLLPILDGFDMAQAAATNARGDKLASLQTGVAMIQS